jgi:hypothetical protein
MNEFPAKGAKGQRTQRDNRTPLPYSLRPWLLCVLCGKQGAMNEFPAKGAKGQRTQREMKIPVPQECFNASFTGNS